MKLAALVVISLASLGTKSVSWGVATRSSGMGMLKGVFDTGCRYSHSARDDPLLLAGQPGMSHLHDFFGNRTTDATSTGRSLLAAVRENPRNVTCKDSRDASAYWAPALYEDGRRLLPQKVHVYYRHHASIRANPFPTGFGMVTHRHFWWCGPGTTRSRDAVPACAGGRLFVILNFPMCWDGTRLFSTDGSHVSYGATGCNTTHPVRLPHLTMFLSYRVDGQPHAYNLASGSPGTAHADFLNGWDPDRLAYLVNACLNKSAGTDCKKSR